MGATNPTVERYLRRIGVVRDPGPASLPLLAELQLAHLASVPFENLDVFHRRPVRTDVDWSIAKVVDRRRGGWCFELNGAFGWLLAELGFDVDRVSCRVAEDDGWGPDLDHCALVVHLDGERWFVDVGFGDCPMVPIPLVDGDQHAVPRAVRCRLDGPGFVIAEGRPDGGWADRLWGSFEPRSMRDFVSRSDHLRTEPGLAWTRQPFATRAVGADGSRVTLRPGVLRTRVGSGGFEERPVRADEWSCVLMEQFGLVDALDRDETVAARSSDEPGSAEPTVTGCDGGG